MNIAINLSNKFWKTPQGVETFSSNGAAWGVVNSKGKVLAKNGVPCTWRTKRLVVNDIAPYADGFMGHEWICIYDSKKEAIA
jgi:hypothetical protein